MQFPYTEVAPGIFRPLAPVAIWTPTAVYTTDGLLDTAADRAIIGATTARKLGIEWNSLTEEVLIKSATGQLLVCRKHSVVMELRRDSSRILWNAEVAVSKQALRYAHWGLKGFLEFFAAYFNGPERYVTLTPGANLPATSPPPLNAASQ